MLAGAPSELNICLNCSKCYLHVHYNFVWDKSTDVNYMVIARGIKIKCIHLIKDLLIKKTNKTFLQNVYIYNVVLYKYLHFTIKKAFIVPESCFLFTKIKLWLSNHCF